ncbi:hypothetical protein [Azospirillum sp. ST 5-10]|uniref:hypothetical protein n=1 Tax=unclassified Azospirillum TaxID=2630922 RepID=UPI003F49F7EE
MTRADAAFAVLSLLLAAALALLLRDGPAEGGEAPAAAVPAAPAVEPASGFAPPPLAAFAAVVERPLFVPERRPAPPAAAATAAVGLRLVGIVGVGGRTAAVLRSDDGRTVTAAPGEGGEGWRVLEVGVDRVVLDHGGARRELELTARPDGGGRPGAARTPTPGGTATAVRPPPTDGRPRAVHYGDAAADPDERRD